MVWKGAKGTVCQAFVRPGVPRPQKRTFGTNHESGAVRSSCEVRGQQDGKPGNVCVGVCVCFFLFFFFCEQNILELDPTAPESEKQPFSTRKNKSCNSDPLFACFKFQTVTWRRIVVGYNGCLSHDRTPHRRHTFNPFCAQVRSFLHVDLKKLVMQRLKDQFI